ncbi:olfactory receptor 2T7-like [Pollicipes pollicipes]|uniref:olfactory receptor 2T7-like n=1 Tax=Pollicipes pollicipes TaxID=41117 RepID=UPI0018859E94|nr:olfactory receptor 2T7-like [Pollicipes pollicipes]
MVPWLKVAVGSALALNFSIPLLVIGRTKTLHDEPMALLVANLALADILFVLNLVLIGCLDLIFNHVLYAACQSVQIAAACFGIALKMTQTLVALDQFIAVVYPLHYRDIMDRWTKWLLVLPWLAVLFTAVLLVIGRTNTLHDEPTAPLVANLALADLLCVMSVLLIGIVDLIFNRVLYVGCRFVQIAAACFAIALKMTQMLVALDQFIAVVYLLHYRDIMDLFACLGFLSPVNRGSLMTCGLMLCVCLGTPAGYVSARIYKSESDGEKWGLDVLLTLTLCLG